MLLDSFCGEGMFQFSDLDFFLWASPDVYF